MRPAGLEPATCGLGNRRSENTRAEKTKSCKTAKQQLTPQLTHNSQKQSELDTSKLPVDLAELVTVWPNLPEHIKAAIKALVRTNTAP